MFAEFSGQSRVTCDLIEKTANHLDTTDIPDSLTDGTSSLFVFIGGEMMDAGTYSGGFTAELTKLYKFHPGAVVERKVGTRYQRIDFFTSGHVPIYETYRYPNTQELKGYIFSLYENQKLSLSNPVGAGNIPEGFKWNSGYNHHRVQALVNKAPVFHVTVSIGDTNARAIGSLFEKLYTKIAARELDLLTRKNTEEKRRNDEAAEKLRLEGLDRVNRALDFFEK